MTLAPPQPSPNNKNQEHYLEREFKFVVIGTDVSFWQDDPSTPVGIDFARMAQAGAKFTIIRAGQNYWQDNEFKISWKAAKDAGIPRGSYWFYDSRVPAKPQAELWVKILDGDLGELPLWCDFEDNYGGDFGGWKNFYNFIEAVKALVPNKQIGIYTNYYYWLENTIVKGIPTASLNYFKQYPLWLAAYNNVGPDIPAPWDAWDIWQFTDNGDGDLYGAESGNIDLNYFNGDEEAFRARFGLGSAPQPEASDEAWQVSAIYQGQEVIYKELK